MQRVFGRHLVVELIGCHADTLASASELEALLARALREARASVIERHVHQFQPCGASGTFLLAESHLSFHTWPEDGYMSLDLFTCGDRVSPERVVEIVEAAVGAERSTVRQLERGY